MYQRNTVPAPYVQTHASVCELIKKNPNYKPEISDKDLMALVMQDGVALHAPRKTALAISHYGEGESYTYFQLRFATKHYGPDADSPPCWMVDANHMIGVSKQDGSMKSFMYADKNTFIAKPDNIDLCKRFLVHECLHPLAAEQNSNTVEKRMAK